METDGEIKRKLRIRNIEKNKNKITIAMGYVNDQVGKNITADYFNILKINMDMYTNSIYD